MRKLIKSFSVVLIAALLLTGCNSKVVTQVSDADEVILKVGDREVNKQEVYRTMVQQYGANHVINTFLEKVLEENIELTDEEIKEAKKDLEKQKEQFGDNFEQMIKGYGYADEEEFFQNVILANMKNDKLIELYVTEEFDALVEKFMPTKLRYMTISNEEAANEALSTLQNENEEDNWESIVEKYASEPDATTEEFVLIHDQFQGPDIIKEIVAEKPQPGLMKKTYLEGGQYYIVEVMEVAEDKFKEEVSDILKSDEYKQLIQVSMLEHYANVMNFTIHDTDIFNAIKEIAPGIVE